MAYIEQRRSRRNTTLSVLLAVMCFLLWFAMAHHRRLQRQRQADAPETSSAKTIIIAQPNDADTLDPSDVGAANTLNIARMLFATLYDVSAKGDLEPFLAESYQYSEDGRSITFQLRPGLKCEDGSPLMASDVAYSFERAANPRNHFTGNAPGFLLPSIGYLGSHVDGPLSVTIKTQKYNPIAIGLISEMLVSCRRPYEKLSLGDAATHPQFDRSIPSRGMGS